MPIEHRGEEEIRNGFGTLTSPEGVPIWSPAFDVTPAELITGIITEYGIIQAPFAEGLEDAVEAADDALDDARHSHDE